MIKKNILILIFVSFGILPVWGRTAAGDIIFLKDGTREESDRVWESDVYVHFILKGTKTVEVRYAKEFVDHIVHTSDKKVTRQESANPKQQPASSSADNRSAPNQKTGTSEEGKKIRLQPSFGEKVVKDNKGISFYDPHRPLRYWADRNDKYKTLDEALLKLAQTYGRSVEWIRQNMGEENDLGIIHFNLVQHLEGEEQSQGMGTHEKDQTLLKKNTSDTSESDDLGKPYSSRKPSVSVPVVVTTTSQAPSHETLFYDPRREKKYWISSSEGFNTLHEALSALAQTYKVSVGWIEDHMGDSNSVEEIHKNIRSNLSAGTDANKN